MNYSDMLKKLDRVNDLPTLPAIAMELNEMLTKSDVTIDQVRCLIEKDQAMVPKILRLVNSAFYGFQSKISTVSRALVILGFNTVRNAIVSVSIIKAISFESEVKAFDVTAFWRHSIAVAMTSRYLAYKTKWVPEEDAFTAGLLHDIGKLVLLRYFPELFQKIISAMDSDNISFVEAEHKEIPANHPKIGAYLAKRWKLPKRLLDAIAYHHSIHRSDIDRSAIIVHVADQVVNSMDAETEIDMNALDRIDSNLSSEISAEIKAAAEWYPVISSETESACALFLREQYNG